MRKHRYYKVENLEPSDTLDIQLRIEQDRKEQEVKTKEEANLISSRLVDSDFHMPIFDFDFPCELIPSSSAGHFHFYMYKECTWPQYMAVLTAMAAAGLIEVNYVQASIARRATFVRKPGILKVMEDES